MRTYKFLLLLFFTFFLFSFALINPQQSLAQELRLRDTPTTDGFRVDYRGLQPGTCYGFKIKNTTTQQVTQGSRSGCGVLGIGINAPEGMYKISDDFGTAGDINVGVSTGAYEVTLHLLTCGAVGQNCNWSAPSGNTLAVTVGQGSNPPSCTPGSPGCTCTPDMQGGTSCVGPTSPASAQPTVNQTPAPPPCSTNLANCQTGFGGLDVTDPTQFLKSLYSIVLVFAGIGAIGLIIYAGYILMVTGGDKTQVQKAREIITSAILGLLFIIFAIAILEFIGINVLKIPGFVGN